MCGKWSTMPLSSEKLFESSDLFLYQPKDFNRGMYQVGKEPIPIMSEAARIDRPDYGQTRR